MAFEVYEADFVKGVKKDDLKDTWNSLDDAKSHAYRIAKAFCEDEEPRIRQIPSFQHKNKKRLWIFDTDCDFGSIIKEV